MALVKCKECGEKVSTDAKTCQNCGAKAPKKTSLFTWLVLIFIISVVYIGSQTPSTTGTSSSARTGTATSSGSSTAQRSTPATASWSNFTSRDEMTSKLSAFATSSKVGSTSPMEFPYSGTQAWLGVGCDGQSEWAYFGFSEAPNLNNTDTGDGYNVVRTRVRWNDTVETTTFTQQWGDAFLNFRDDKSAISKIAGAKTVLLELDWHGQRSVYFEVTLNGSSSAISSMRSQCAK